ncbi:MAG TPA: tetratricopeptide repeat protein [Candidatus Obscuribacter sp.]|nr:tetratricopeptide repeat protein [Candidatus Obscuribacter sp.]
MFKKKTDGKGKGDAPASAQEPAAAQASPPASPATPTPSSSGSGLTPPPAAGPNQSQVGLPGAPPDSAQGGRNPYKISIVSDVLMPLALAGVCVGAFGATFKIVPDKTGVYGVDKELVGLEVKDASLVSPKLLEEVEQLEPVKLLRKGDNAAALAAAKALAAKKPEDVRALMACAKVLIEAGSKADKENGLNLIGKACELVTYSPLLQLEYARDLNLLNRDDDAVAAYEKIVRRFPDAAMQAKKEVADLYLKTNRSADAVKTLTELIASDPKDPSFERKLGLALAQDGKQQEGFEEFRKGFTKEQDVLGYPYAVHELVSKHAGLVEAALSEAEKKVAKNPHDLEGMLTLARLYIGTNKLKEARDTLEKARKLQELNPDLHEIMAEVMCRQNQSTSGFDEFRMAVSNLHLKD